MCDKAQLPANLAYGHDGHVIHAPVRVAQQVAEPVESLDEVVSAGFGYDQHLADEHVPVFAQPDPGVGDPGLVEGGGYRCGCESTGWCLRAPCCGGTGAW